MAELKQGSYTRTGGAPERDPIIPRFHLAEIEDMAATAREGRPIFRTEERVEMIMPGIANLMKPVHRVTDEYRQRWPEQYERFRKGQEMSHSGTPIEQWNILKRAMVLELKALEIHTIEDCAGLSDTACQRIPRIGYTLRDRAKAYLDDAERMRQVTELQAIKDANDQKIADLTAKLEQQGELLERVSAQLIHLQNAPNPLAATAPMSLDPMEALRQGQPHAAPARSSLDDLAALPPAKPRGKKDAA